MSRAFTHEDENESLLTDIGERPVSPHRNLVTAKGLAQIEASLAFFRDELAEAERAADRERLATASRDLRYWSARRESAELSVPEPDSTVVRFGMTVTLKGEDDALHTWGIVGEDEADAAHGSISHVSPMAKALFGKSVGDEVIVNGRGWEITAIIS